MVKKVAIIGTHGVGKTTLAETCLATIRSLVPDYPLLYLREQAKEWLDRYDYDWKTSHISQYAEYEQALFHYFNFGFMFNRPTLSDRCPIDVLAYSKLFAPKSIFDLLRSQFLELAPMYQYGIQYYFYVSEELDDIALDVQNTIELLLKQLNIQYTAFGRAEHTAIHDSIVKYFLDGYNLETGEKTV
jgi:hypothetical protein